MTGARAFFFLLIFLLSADAALAAKRVAFVVGNNKYQAITELQRAVNDADAVAGALRTIGFKVDEGFNLTRREFNARFSAFVASVQPGDTAFFFFAGHGVAADSGQNILLPIDVPSAHSADLIADEGHIVDELIARVKMKGALVSMFVLDACRNNPFQDGTGRSVGMSRGLQGVTPPTGSFVLMAAGTNQEALDRLPGDDPDPNSLFTRKLLPLLTQPGITHLDLAKQVQMQVASDARKVRREQQPAFYDQIDGFVYLVPPESGSNAVASTSKTSAQQTTQPIEEKEVSIRIPAEKPITREATTTDENQIDEGGKSKAAEQLSLSSDMQQELKRVGCYVGAVDGIWGNQSRNALSAFAKHADVHIPDFNPSSKLLDQIQGETGRVCPLACGPRHEITNNRCVLKSCPSGQSLSRTGTCYTQEKKRPSVKSEAKRECSSKVRTKYMTCRKSGGSFVGCMSILKDC
jgi:hypothetical protein